MAISIIGSGSQSISAPSSWVLQEITGPGAYAAFVDLQHHNGLDVRLAWFNDDADEPAVSWASHITVDNTGTDGPVSILTPPVPIFYTGRLLFDFYAGTPGSPANVPWVVYKL